MKYTIEDEGIELTVGRYIRVYHWGAYQGRIDPKTRQAFTSPKVSGGVLDTFNAMGWGMDDVLAFVAAQEGK